MANKQKQKKELSPNAQTALMIAIMAIIILAIYFVGVYQVSDGQIVPKPTPTPWPTATPSYFEVIGRVQRIQIVGSDWDGYRTWVTLKVIKADRMFVKGEVLNLKLPIEANTNLDQGDQIRLMCEGAYNKLLSCTSTYEVLKE